MGCPVHRLRLVLPLFRSHYNERSANLKKNCNVEIQSSRISDRNMSSAVAGVHADARIHAYDDKCRLFATPAVQQLLLKMTKADPTITLTEIQRKKKLWKITLMSDDQLKEAESKANEMALTYVQMPPVLPARTDIDCVLSRDEKIAGFSKSKHIFTDITLGLHEQERNIVVRDVDGTLRLATCDMRDRICQVYYPRNGRNIIPAAMFFGEHRRRLIEEQKYRYLLDNACAQFEPDNPQFIEICHQVYQHCDQTRSYEKLRSTRHYGPMVFYYVCSKRVTNILKTCLLSSRFNDVINIIELFNLVWQRTHQPPVKICSKAHIDFLLGFLQSEALLSSDVAIELQQYSEVAQLKTDEFGHSDSSDSGDSSSCSSESDQDEPDRK